MVKLWKSTYIFLIRIQEIMRYFLGKKVSVHRCRQYFIKIPDDHTSMKVTYTVQNCKLTTIIGRISYQICCLYFTK